MTLPDDEKLSDPLDRASATEMQSTELALADVQRACRRQQEPGPDGTYKIVDCEDCGLEIGEGRLRVSIKNKLCVFCATRLEKRR